ncbi:MAG: NAD(P)-binding protein [bacterium]|nr:NAD(P)-binding protein [bacterium]
MKILIAGGGIGGLTAALCLHQAGHDVSIFESALELGEIGAGIQLGANAIRVLDSLGLRDDLDKVVVRPETIRFRLFDTGETLHEVPLGQAYEERYGAPYFHVHRADIHGILAKALLAAAPDSVHLGAHAEGFDERADGVTLRLADGRSFDGDVLVGADGIKSAIRTAIVGETPVNWTRMVAWRATVESKRLPADFMDTIVSNFVGPHKHVVIYYLRRKELVNLVGVVENDSWREESWTVKAPWEELKADYEGWAPTVQTLIDAVPKDECYRWALFNRIPIESWSSDHATLLGDAAHATLPFMASGAAMAIEDARVLARALDQEDSVAEGLQCYQSNRLERTARIVNTSTAMGQVYHQPDADAFRQQFAAVRTAAAASSSEPPDQWLGKYDANNVELV